jgi:hypothetical protein
LGGIALAFAAVFTCAPPVPLAHAQSKKESRSTAKAKAPAGPVPANIDRNGVLILVRSTLLALDQANKTGNYTVLRELGAPGFQSNTDARLAEIFASQRSQGIDLNGVAVLEPQLTLPPRIETNGMLHMAGFFPSVPMQVNFELLFAPSQGQWKVFGVAVNLAKGSPQAPDAPVAAKSDPPAKSEPPPLPPTVSIDVKNRSAK